MTGSYSCYAPVAAGSFTVPSWALLALPAGTGSTTVINGSAFGSFTASGIDFGLTFGEILQDVVTAFN